MDLIRLSRGSGRIDPSRRWVPRHWLTPQN